MAATTTRQPELVLAQEIITLARTNVRGALARAERAAVKYPDFRIPAGEGQPTPTFGQVADWLRGQVSEAPAAAAAESAPVKAAPVKAAPAKKAPAARKVAPVKAPEPVKVAVTTLRLVHDGEHQTSIYGVEKGSPAQLAIGSAKRGGLGWNFWLNGGMATWYLPRTQGHAADMARIGEAVTRLESLTQDGQKLYRVEQDIRTADPAGNPLPVRMNRAQAAEWQRDYTAAHNSAGWLLGMGRAVCGKCGAAGLDVSTGRIGKDAAGMPTVECATCGGFAVATPEPVKVEPVRLDLSGMIALSAVPEPKPESVECPVCKQDVPVTGGKLALHNDRFGRGACRGKLGQVVTDVEPEPAPVKAAARKAAAPVAAEPEESGDVDGTVVRMALQAGMSSSARNATAHEARQVLSRKLTYGKAFRGVKVETRRDKVNHRLVMTVVEGGDGFDVAELAEEIAKIVKTVRGVGNRVHKA